MEEEPFFGDMDDIPTIQSYPTSVTKDNNKASSGLSQKDIPIKSTSTFSTIEDPFFDSMNNRSASVRSRRSSLISNDNTPESGLRLRQKNCSNSIISNSQDIVPTPAFANSTPIPIPSSQPSSSISSLTCSKYPVYSASPSQRSQLPSTSYMTSSSFFGTSPSTQQVTPSPIQKTLWKEKASTYNPRVPLSTHMKLVLKEKEQPPFEHMKQLKAYSLIPTPSSVPSHLDINKTGSTANSRAHISAELLSLASKLPPKSAPRSSLYFSEKIKEVEHTFSYMGPIARNVIIHAMECIYELTNSKALLGCLITSAQVTSEMQMNVDAVLAALFFEARHFSFTLNDILIREKAGNEAFKLFKESKDVFNVIEMVPTTTHNIHVLRNLVIATASDWRSIAIVASAVVTEWRNKSQDPCNSSDRAVLAHKTLSVYAPLANRLGVWCLQSELEEYAFETLYPEQCAKLRLLLGQKLEEYAFVLEETKEKLERVFSTRPKLRNAVQAIRVRGRVKSIFSVFKKLQRSGKSALEEVYDLLALRIVVEPRMTNNTEEEERRICKIVAEIVHENWLVIPGRNKDYISEPKKNGYQSIHSTVLAGDNNLPLEIQIRTERMHRFAEYGRAAHWMYKQESYEESAPSLHPRDEFSLGDQDDLNLNQRDITDEIFSESPAFKSHAEYLSAVNKAVRENQVIVLEGDKLYALQAGATVYDLAYNGRKMSSQDLRTCNDACALVNGVSVPLDYKLEMKDVISFNRK